ncbi:hypothetical protein [Streptomyces sp. NPDC058653]|uniref:hypothetical protein n=1 Tax=Streptomyces sp. NPDC058653 TaxID=3346576 RepID=UPI0036545AAB
MEPLSGVMRPRAERIGPDPAAFAHTVRSARETTDTDTDGSRHSLVRGMIHKPG